MWSKESRGGRAGSSRGIKESWKVEIWHMQVTGRAGLKQRDTSQPRWVYLGWGSSVPAACSRGRARRLRPPPPGCLWAPGSRWVIGAVDSSTQQSLPGPAAHNDLLQGNYSHCHSDAPLQFTGVIPLRAGGQPGMGGLTAVPGFVCVRERELVRNNSFVFSFNHKV